MDLMTMGKVSSYIRQKNLAFAANYKISTGQRVTDANGNLNFAESSMFKQINEATKKSADEIKTARLATIKSKLMSGRKLTSEEMAYLRDNDDDLYKKAKHAEDAREELKAELKGAKTKQEARQILTRAMIKASAEASAELAAANGIGGSGAASAGVAGGATGEISAVTGDVGVSAENISAGEISTTENISNVDATENVSATENPTAENSTNVNENSKAENNSSVNGDSDKNNDTTQGILEKFIMTIRALEDEWTKFVNSDEYKDLPEDYYEDETVYKVAQTPNKKVLDAIFTYRQAALEQSMPSYF